MPRPIPIAILLAASVAPPSSAAPAFSPCAPVPGVNDVCAVWAAPFDTPEHRRWLGADARDAATTPDGETILVAGQAPDAGGAPGLSVVALDASDGDRLWSFADSRGRAGRASAVAATDDLVVVVGATEIVDDGVADGEMVALERATGAVRWHARFEGSTDHLDELTEATFSADGGTLYVAGHTGDDYGFRDAVILAVDPRDGRTRWTRTMGAAEFSEELVGALVLAPHGGPVVATTEDFWGRGLFVVHRFGPEGQSLGAIREQAGPTTRGVLQDFAMSPDGSLGVAVGGRLYSHGPTAGPRIVVFSMEDATQRWDAWIGDSGQALSAAFAPDGGRVYVSGYEAATTDVVTPPATVGTGNGLDHRVYAFTSGTGHELWEHRFHSGGFGDDVVADLATTADGSTVVAAGYVSRAGLPFAGLDPATDCATQVGTTCYRTWTTTQLTLTGLDAASGGVAWRARHRMSEASEAASVRELILAPGGRAYLAATVSSRREEPAAPGYVTRFETAAFDVPA